LESWAGLPKIKNSVFEGLRERRLADIQVATSEMADWRWVIEVGKRVGRNEMKS